MKILKINNEYTFNVPTELNDLTFEQIAKIDEYHTSIKNKEVDEHIYLFDIISIILNTDVRQLPTEIYSKVLEYINIEEILKQTNPDIQDVLVIRHNGKEYGMIRDLKELPVYRYDEILQTISKISKQELSPYRILPAIIKNIYFPIIGYEKPYPYYRHIWHLFLYRILRLAGIKEDKPKYKKVYKINIKDENNSSDELINIIPISYYGTIMNFFFILRIAFKKPSLTYTRKKEVKKKKN